MTYWNTTREYGKKLAEYEGRAATQEDRILALFAGNPDLELSPSGVLAALAMHTTPLTSVRRAVTNLTNEGRLERMAKKVDGPYGRPEHLWRLARPRSMQEDWING